MRLRSRAFAETDRDPLVAALWSEPVPRRPALTRKRIIGEVLDLLDEVGVDGLTIRRLAERLGIQGASLYKQILDKDELVALLADAIAGDVRPPPARAKLVQRYCQCEFRRAGWG
jgi:AcrR family transcriptional regulator